MCLRWHILRSYQFLAKVTFKLGQNIYEWKTSRFLLECELKYFFPNFYVKEFGVKKAEYSVFLPSYSNTEKKLYCVLQQNFVEKLVLRKT